LSVSRVACPGIALHDPHFTDSRANLMIEKRLDTSEVIIEMRPVGAVVRVAAVDVKTGTEVVVMGPATAPQRALEELAINKLKKKLAVDK
jgi:hypothetical protein